MLLIKVHTWLISADKMQIFSYTIFGQPGNKLFFKPILAIFRHLEKHGKLTEVTINNKHIVKKINKDPGRKDGQVFFIKGL